MRPPLLDRAPRLPSRLSPDGSQPSAAEGSMILVKSLYLMAGSIAAVFSNLYLFKLGGFAGLSWYYIGTFATLSLGFIAAGRLMRRWTLGHSMALGTLVLAGVYTSLPFIETSGIATMLLLGAANGIGEGFFWSASNVAEYVAAHPERRAAFLGRMQFWNGIASTVGPPVGGLLFAIAAFTGQREHGYTLLFAAMVVSLLIVAVTAKRTISYSGIKFETRDIGRGIRDSTWRNILAQWFVRGLWDCTLPALAAALVLVAIESELGVAVVAALSCIVGAVVARQAGKVLQRHHQAFLIGALFVPFGLLGFATSNGLLSVLCLIFIVRAFDPFSSITMFRDSFVGLDRNSDHWTTAFNRQVEVEIAINAGRLVSFGAVLVLIGADSHSTEQARLAIVLLAVAPLAAGFLQHRFARIVNAKA